MKKHRANFSREFLALARHSLEVHHLPRIAGCLNLLSEQEVWWRPNAASNSVGNLVMHLEGNVRQWIISGLGGAPDRRQRDREFAERGPVPRRTLLAHLRKTVAEAGRILKRMSFHDLARAHAIQKFQVTGFEAVCHVVDHFAYHSGQIIFITKLKRGEDLGFTRLPGEKPRKTRARNLPAI